MRILIIENNEEVNQNISSIITEKEYQFDIAENSADAKYLVEIRHYELVILSWPQTAQNLDLINTIKSESPKTSIIVISDNGTKDSEIEALKSGADDFIVKPLDYDILSVRMEAKLRFGVSNIIEIEDLIINPEEEKIIYQDTEIELKGKPFEVLTHLAMHKDQIVSKEQLLDAIWEEPELVTPNVIEVAINQIRQKMDKPLDITTIETVRRRGYRFCFPNKVSY